MQALIILDFITDEELITKLISVNFAISYKNAIIISEYDMNQTWNFDSL